MLEYQPNAWALEHVHTRDERFCAYVTCRQCGKTWAAAMEIDLGMTETPIDGFGPPHVGVLSYDYKRAELSVMRYISAVKKAFGNDYIKVNMNKHEALIPTSGAMLTWMSAEDSEAGIGFTFTKLIIDEGQKVPDIVMEKIWPAIDARMARVRAFGTPDITPDQTWFRGMFLRGQDDADPNYYCYTLSWHENPWMTAEAVTTARETLPERVFKMLYLGEWVDEEGAVFPHLDAALLAETPEYNPQHRYILSVDFAIKDDFTVVMVGEEATRRVIHMARWNQTDPITTYDRVKEIWLKYGQPQVIADESGMGMGMVPELRERGMRVRGVKFTYMGDNAKMPMIMRLQGAIEHGRIRFPVWDILLTELRSFVYKETPSGKISAAAASGYHDDCVTTLLLLNEGMRYSPTAQQQYDYTEGNRSDGRRKDATFLRRIIR